MTTYGQADHKPLGHCSTGHRVYESKKARCVHIQHFRTNRAIYRVTEPKGAKQAFPLLRLVFLDFGSIQPVENRQHTQSYPAFCWITRRTTLLTDTFMDDFHVQFFNLIRETLRFYVVIIRTDKLPQLNLSMAASIDTAVVQARIKP